MVPPRRRAGECKRHRSIEATARLMIARASQSAATAHINQSKLARKSCARSCIARGNEPQGVQRRTCGCSVKPLSTLIYCFAASRSVACVWRLCVRRCASALEVESAPFLLGQNRPIGAPLLEKELESHAKNNCCGQHGTTTAGATRTTATTTFFNQLKSSTPAHALLPNSSLASFSHTSTSQPPFTPADRSSYLHHDTQ